MDVSSLFISHCVMTGRYCRVRLKRGHYVVALLCVVCTEIAQFRAPGLARVVDRARVATGEVSHLTDELTAVCALAFVSNLL